jgi:hypothetical protein
MMNHVYLSPRLGLPKKQFQKENHVFGNLVFFIKKGLLYSNKKRILENISTLWHLRD